MKRIASAAILAAILAAGCNGNYTEPVPRVRALSPAEKNFDDLWQASVHVLRQYGFTLSVQDRREGLITTEPLVGQYPLELWRKDASTRRDLIENALQTTYRTAVITIQAVPESDRYRALIRIETARSDRQEPQITTASQVLALGRSVIRPRDLKAEDMVNPSEDDDNATRSSRKRDRDKEREDEFNGQQAGDGGTVALGRDSKLELRLAKAVLDACGQQARPE